MSGLFLFISCETDEKGVQVVAHRGAMNERPENTMAAFERALEAGADIVEIDLWTSADNQIFILHDRTLDRTTDGEGIASDYTLDELQEYDAGSWFDTAYSDQSIPSFDQVLQWSATEDVVLLLDLKEQGRDYAERVAASVERYGQPTNIVVGVRSTEQAGKFHELLPDSRQLGFIGSSEEIEAYAEAGVDIIRLWLNWLEEDAQLADRVRDSGCRLMINGTDGEMEEARAIIQYSPDWILIDNPVMLQASLRELGVRE